MAFSWHKHTWLLNSIIPRRRGWVNVIGCPSQCLALNVGRYDVLAREKPKFVRRFADVGRQGGRKVQSYVNGE